MGRVATELGELAVVPMTWRKERPASVLALFDFAEDFAMCEVGVNRTPQGPTLNLEFVGGAMATIEGASLFRWGQMRAEVSDVDQKESKSDISVE